MTTMWQLLMGNLSAINTNLIQGYLPTESKGVTYKRLFYRLTSFLMGVYLLYLMYQMVPYYQYGLALLQGSQWYWTVAGLLGMLLIGWLELYIFKQLIRHARYPQRDKSSGWMNWIYYVGFTTLLLVVVNYISSYMLAPVAGNSSVNQASVNETVNNTPTLLVIVLMILGPIIEEYFYRGVLMNWVNTDKEGYTLLSVVVSGLVFGIAHASGGATPLYFMTIVIAGLLLAEAYRETNNLRMVIVIHICYDLIATFM